jgi:protein-S-isoprenylcysteine O-methyltransferase Ste14
MRMMNDERPDRMRSGGGMLLFLKNLVFTVVVPGTVAVYIPLRMAARPDAPSTGAWGWSLLAAAPLLLFGAVVTLRCVWDFGTTGRGTPAPIDAPRHLVFVGLYQYVRNPMYLGVVSVIAGWAAYFRSWRIFLYGCVLGLVFHLFVVFVEEPRLRRRFGESYDRYCHAVRRWIPGRRVVINTISNGGRVGCDTRISR